MNNLSNEEIRRKINNLLEKIDDCKSYLSSDCCNACSQMMNNISKYEEEIKFLKTLYHND